MTRRRIVATLSGPVLAAALAGLPACSAIGDPGGMPRGYPHGGTGQFRPLEPDEVGIADGRAIALQNTAIEAAMVAGGFLYYAAAPRLDEPPEPPEGFPESEVLWDAFAPRAIFRSEPRDNLGFSRGTQVLAASEAWEGEEVFDPWAVIDGDVVRLYYAAEGGIGVATSTGGGAFARERAPILDGDDALAGVPRRPSVVRGPDGAWWMYYDAGGAIGVARSEDGIAFARIDADPSTPAIDPIVIEGDDGRDTEELSVGHPGAVSLVTITGRHLVRVYFESRRDDGTILPYVAGSEDGVNFERHEVPIMAELDVRFPSPLLLDDRVTLLYANVPFRSGGHQMRKLIGAVSPAGESFAPDE
ncbi:MAG TPA: hypothetical protein VIL20_09210 [Sandaracinaceae bacterium]